MIQQLWIYLSVVAKPQIAFLQNFQKVTGTISELTPSLWPTASLMLRMPSRLEPKPDVVLKKCSEWAVASLRLRNPPKTVF